MLVAPGAQRRDLQRRPTGEQAVYHTDGRRTVGHRHLDLEADIAEVVAPAGDAVVEVERGNPFVATWRDRPIAPLVGGELDAFAVDDHDRVERGEAEHACRPGRRRRHHQQPVVPARPQPGHRAHGVPAEAVGDEPLAAARLIERAAHLTAEGDPQVVHVARHCSADVTSGSGRQIRSATSPVQPV